jgi:excisionase family DNA binding protein
MPRLLLTADEVAETLAIGRTKVYELIRTGRLGSVRLDGMRRIPTDALSEFVATLTEDEPGD